MRGENVILFGFKYGVIRVVGCGLEREEGVGDVVVLFEYFLEWYFCRIWDFCGFFL